MPTKDKAAGLGTAAASISHYTSNYTLSEALARISHRWYGRRPYLVA
jgi:hypothetical protein